MPEEEPLQTLTALERVGEPEVVLGVVLFDEIEEFGGGLHDGEGRGLAAVEEDGDTAVGVKAKEPFVLLDVGGYVAVKVSWLGGAIEKGEYVETYMS
jgi:hypothetical protein